MRIDSLHVYPVKSTAGMAAESAQVRPEGLRDDRRWMVVDASGHKLTARERHRLLHVRAEPDGSGGLKIAYRDGSLPPLYVPQPEHALDVSDRRPDPDRPFPLQRRGRRRRCAVRRRRVATRTLARHRHWAGKVWFGVRLVPEAPGTISVGDGVEPMRK